MELKDLFTYLENFDWTFFFSYFGLIIGIIGIRISLYLFKKGKLIKFPICY
jgi:hypothetical protein